MGRKTPQEKKDLARSMAFFKAEPDYEQKLRTWILEMQHVYPIA